MGMAALQRQVDGLPVGQRSALIQVLDQVAAALLRREPRQLQRLSVLMRQTAARTVNGEAEERRELEVQNVLRVLAAAGEVERQSLNARQLGVSRQRLNQLRQEGRLLGVKLPMHREFLYPRWQFGKGARVLPIVPKLIAVAREAGLDGLDLHLLMTASRRKGERPLVDLLPAAGPRAERYLLGLIRGSG